MKRLLMLVCFSMVLVSCEETDILNETGKMQVSDFNLPELPSGYYYEGWLLVDGSYVSVGKITNDSISNGIARFSKIEATDLATAQSFALTVETNDSPAPSNYVLLVGNFDGNTASLASSGETVNGVLSLANRISAAYTVQNASVPESEAGNYETNGIWFFKGTGENLEPALHLEYNNLKYQAWLIKTADNLDYNLNMGVIENDTIPDNSRMFIPSAFASNAPDFPGEDFLQLPGNSNGSYPEGFFPVDVREAKLIITPIPAGFNSLETPFPIHLLEAIVPADAQKDPNLTRDLQVNTNFGATATKL